MNNLAGKFTATFFGGIFVGAMVVLLAIGQRVPC